MRRRLVHAGAWALATGAAVTLSWFGVHTVLSSTAYDPPRATPISGGGSTETDESSTQRPVPSPSSSASPSSPAPSKSPSDKPSKSGKPGDDQSDAPAPPSSTAQSGNVENYPADGGWAVFELHPDSATLVSATPKSGWQVQVWTHEQWIRVTFSKDGRESSIFATWHDSAPRVQIDER